MSNGLNIKKLILKRFRSAPAETITFSNPLFLVGKNGSGKTNLVDAFAFLSECMLQPLQGVFDKRGGISAVRHRSAGPSYPPNLGMRIEFDFKNGSPVEGWYAFEIKALPKYGFKVVREKCVLGGNSARYFDRFDDEFHSPFKLSPSLDAQALALPVIGGLKDFAPVLRGLSAMRTYSIQPAEVAELQEPDVGDNLKSDGSNVASVLQKMERESPQEFVRLCEILAAIVPGTKQVKPVKHGKKLSLQFTQEWGEGKKINFEAFAMSDGTLRALGILAALWQKPAPSLIAIEEPESTIHPEALGAILDVIRMTASKTQVIVTTHSPDVLDAKWIEPENLRIVTWAEGTTRVHPLGEASVKALRNHLMGAGELFRSNALQPDEQPLFEPSDSDQMQLFSDNGR
jgi:predicted ATPase